MTLSRDRRTEEAMLSTSKLSRNFQVNRSATDGTLERSLGTEGGKLSGKKTEINDMFILFFCKRRVYENYYYWWWAWRL